MSISRWPILIASLWLCASLARSEEPANTPPPTDMLLLTAERPIWVRLHVWMGEQALPDAWHQNAKATFSLLDRNANQQLDGDELQTLESIHSIAISTEMNASSVFGGLIQLLGKKKEQPERRVVDFPVFLRHWQISRPYLESDNRQRVRSPADDIWAIVDQDSDQALSLEELQHLRERLRRWDYEADDRITSSDLRQFQNPFAEATENLDLDSSTGAGFVSTPEQRASTAERMFMLYGEKSAGLQIAVDRLGVPLDLAGSFDTDASGKLSGDELLRLLENFRPELEITVRLPARDATSGDAQLTWQVPEGPSPLPVALEERSDRVVFQIGSSRIQWSANWTATNFDEQYKALFTSADKDENKYLEQQEATESELEDVFQLADADRDGKLLLDELLVYSRQDSEASACQATVAALDSGRVLFSVLDVDRNDSVTAREQLAAAQLLDDWDANRDSRLTLDELPACYDVQLSLGVREDEDDGSATIADEVPAWFTHLDRNDDRDLSREEFPGPRELFEKLDSDGDGLLSVTEAQSAN